MTDIPDDITFDTRDEYLRRPIAEKVIRLLSSDAKVSPIVIDGSWGTGKTEFCRKLINLLEFSKSDLQAVYVDAFASDHADQPLMTLLAAILKVLPEGDRPTLLQKAIPAVRFGLKTTLKAGVSWVLRQDATDLADDFDEDLKKAGDDAVNNAIESMLRDHVEAESSIATLRQALLELTESKPIVIFVDELDRCRPDFAVSLLESIKHVFDVEGVQFVLVTNSSQLLASINHCYGDSVDANRYLDKFLGFSFMLPQSFKRDGHNLTSVSVSHLENLIRASDLLKESCLAKDGLTDFLRELVKANQLSLREVESFIKYCEIYQALTDGAGFGNNVIFGYGLLRALGVFLFCFRPSLAEELANGFVNAPNIIAAMGKSGLFDLAEDKYPDQVDVVAAMVGFETSCDRDQFELATDELREGWAQTIKQYFQGGMRFHEDENVPVIKSTIETLKLND